MLWGKWMELYKILIEVYISLRSLDIPFCWFLWHAQPPPPQVMACSSLYSCSILSWPMSVSLILCSPSFTLTYLSYFDFYWDVSLMCILSGKLVIVLKLSLYFFKIHPMHATMHQLSSRPLLIIFMIHF